MIALLALSGSLRVGSSNAAALRAAELLAPDGVRVVHFAGISDLPHFNPDLDTAPAPPAVAALREAVGAADGLLISCPEYARGIPGAFKNAFDWLVSGTEMNDKPVALINASPRASAAQEVLRLVLATIGARLVDDASVTVALLAKNMTGEMIAADPELATTIRTGIARFAEAIRMGVPESAPIS